MSYFPDPQRYETMKYNRCGRSGLKLPALSLGLWHNFGDTNVFENCRAIIRKAFDSGITHFDVANNYGTPPGSAEETLGKVLKLDLASHRDELVISTKAGWDMWPGPYGNWGSRKHILASVDQSLKRMGLDHVDIFYSHRPDPETPLEETMDALSTVVRQGKALHIGLSMYYHEETLAANKILKELGTPCLIHQRPYSMFVRKLEQGWSDMIDDTGMGGIVFCPLAQGLLTNRYLNGIPTDSRVASTSPHLTDAHITEDYLQKVHRLSEIAVSRGQALSQMALAWVLRKPQVNSAIIGASKVSQLEENLGALKNLTFSQDELELIDSIMPVVDPGH